MALTSINSTFCSVMMDCDFTKRYEQRESSNTISLALSYCEFFWFAPHTGIVGKEDQKILNLVDPKAEKLQNNMVELTKEKPKEVIEAMKSAELPNRHDIRDNTARLASVLDLAYNREIEKFLVDMHGVGPNDSQWRAKFLEMLRALAFRLIPNHLML